MISLQALKVFASEDVADPVKGNLQKKELREEEWLQGWGRLSGVTAQQLNSLMNLLTHASSPTYVSPFLHPESATLQSNTLLGDGQAITEENQPVLFGTYGNSVPDMTGTAPTGFVWVFRNH